MENDAPSEKGGSNKLKLLYSGHFACRDCKFAGICFAKTIEQELDMFMKLYTKLND